MCSRGSMNVSHGFAAGRVVLLRRRGNPAALLARTPSCVPPEPRPNGGRSGDGGCEWVAHSARAPHPHPAPGPRRRARAPGPPRRQRGHRHRGHHRTQPAHGPGSLPPPRAATECTFSWDTSSRLQGGRGGEVCSARPVRRETTVHTLSPRAAQDSVRLWTNAPLEEGAFFQRSVYRMLEGSDERNPNGEWQVRAGACGGFGDRR